MSDDLKSEGSVILCVVLKRIIMIILNFKMQGHVYCGWNSFSLYITLLSL